MNRSASARVVTSLVALAAIVVGFEASAHAAPPFFLDESLGLSAVKVTRPDRSDRAIMGHAGLAFGIVAARRLGIGIGVSYDVLTRTRDTGMHVVDPAFRARYFPGWDRPVVFVELELGGRFVSLPDPSENVRGVVFATTVGIERCWRWNRAFGALLRTAYVPSLSGGGMSTSVTLAFFLALGG